MATSLGWRPPVLVVCCKKRKKYLKYLQIAQDNFHLHEKIETYWVSKKSWPILTLHVSKNTICNANWQLILKIKVLSKIEHGCRNFNTKIKQTLITTFIWLHICGFWKVQIHDTVWYVANLLMLVLLCQDVANGVNLVSKIVLWVYSF